MAMKKRAVRKRAAKKIPLRLGSETEHGTITAISQHGSLVVAIANGKKIGMIVNDTLVSIPTNKRDSLKPMLRQMEEIEFI